MLKFKNTKLLQFDNSINYIETLYLQTNLHEHIESVLPNNQKHDIVLNELYNKLADAEFVGTSKSREWYRFDNYRIGIITDYDLAIKSNWYTVLIQYEQHHLWTLKEGLEDLELPFTADRSLYKIQRADATLIYKSDVDYLNNYRIVSKYRNQYERSKSGIYKIKYLGSVENGNMVRWYDKTAELKDTENYKKMELLSKHFGDIENLYTLELQTHRRFLLREMGIDTLEDITKVKKAYKNIVGGMRLYELNAENEAHRKNRNISRIESFCFSEWVEYERVQKKRYKPSKAYLVDRMAKSTNNYISSIRIPQDEWDNEILSIVNTLLSKVTTGKQDLVISTEDSIETEELKLMKDKHENNRYCDFNIKKEANEAFSYRPFKLNKKTDDLVKNRDHQKREDIKQKILSYKEVIANQNRHKYYDMANIKKELNQLELMIA